MLNLNDWKKNYKITSGMSLNVFEWKQWEIFVFVFGDNTRMSSFASIAVIVSLLLTSDRITSRCMGYSVLHSLCHTEIMLSWQGNL